MYENMDILIFAGFIISLVPGNADGVTSFRRLFTRFSNMHLTAMPIKVIAGFSVEQCARSCVQEVTFECKSFDVDNMDKECHLHNHTMGEPLIGRQVSKFTDHYRTNYERLFNRIPNHVLTMRHRRNIRGLAIEDCARRCILEVNFRCRGFDYERNLKNCWLTDKTTQDVNGLKIRRGTDYYERIQGGPLSNFINFGYGSLQTIEGVQIHNRVVLGVNLDTCAQLCLVEATFKCASFDYVFEEQSCQMSELIAANVHGIQTSFDGVYRVMHFELIEEYLAYFYPTPYAAVLGHNEKTFKKVTPDSCARKCLEEKEFVCRSFDYQIEDGTCLLSHVTGSDVAGGLSSQNGFHVHHFEMKPYLDCGGMFTDESGNFASPNWPRHYSHHLNCSWLIVLPRHRIVRLEFLHLDVGYQTANPCSPDNDVIYVVENGNTIDDQKITCIENHMNEYNSVSNNVTVRFVTNADNDAQGFRIFYSADWPCNVNLTEDNGELASPRWPNTYPPKTFCNWTIISPVLSTIYMRFNSIEMEDHTGSSCRTAYDRVEVYDGASSEDFLLLTLCGDYPPTTVTSTENVLFVKFVSDDRVQTKGFHASYKFMSTSTTSTSAGTTENILYLERTSANNSIPRSNFRSLNKNNTSENNTRSIKTAIKDLKENLGHLLAKFVEPAVNQQETSTKDKRNKSFDNGIIGDDIGMGNGAEIEDKREYDISGLMWGVITSFLFVLLVVLVVLVSVCRYYRRRLPKRRNTTNYAFSEENVSLYNNKDTVSPSTVDPEEDVDEAARLPLPSCSDPPPDIEFHNPMYTRRHGDQNPGTDGDNTEQEHIISEC